MFLDPAQILKSLGISREMTVADFGSGSGGWVIPLSVILKDGLVFAVDIQESSLSALESRLKMQGISNVKKVLANVEEKILEIPENSCDWVLLTDLLFQVDERLEVFKEAKRVLKPQGKILVVEWNLDSAIGPKEGRISPQEIKNLAGNINLELGKEFPAGDYHFALVFIKNSD